MEASGGGRTKPYCPDLPVSSSSSFNASAKLHDEDCRDQGIYIFVAAENPHFVTHLLIFVIILPFSHFLTTPDETSSSERVVGTAAICDRPDNFWPNACVIDAILLVGCIATDGGSQTKKNPMPDHENDPEKLQSSPCRLVVRTFTRSTVTGVRYESICSSSISRNVAVKRGSSKRSGA